MAVYSVNSTQAAILVTELATLDMINGTQTPFQGRDEVLVVVEVAVSAIIITCALFGNLVVVNTLWRKRKNLTRMHFFIYHLCIADIISALFSQFPQFIWDITFLFYAPNFVCKIVKFFALFPIYLSSYILIMTAFDRYLAICHPLLGLRGNQKLRMRSMVAIVWILSAILATPQIRLFSLKYVELYGGSNCMFNKSIMIARLYITCFTLLVFVIPSVLLALIYGQICLAVWKNMGKATGHTKSQKRKNNNASCEEYDESSGVQMKRNGNAHEKEEIQPQLYRSHTAEARVNRAKVKTIKMTLTIVTVYFACWTPFFFALICQLWDLLKLPDGMNTIFSILANLNSCTNPWIYLAFSGNVVGAVKDLFWYCHICREKEHMPMVTTTAQGDEPSGRYVPSPAGPRTTYTSLTGVDKVDNNNAAGNSAF